MTRKSTLADRTRVEQIIGVYDGLSATLADRCGFDWLHVGGYNISGSAFGMPDVGLLTLPEMVEVVRRVVNVTSRPVLVDGDDGYGNFLNVMRLVRMVEATGAGGIHLEDQVFPKKCGHMEGKRIVPAETFVNKIKAFVDTRKSDDFLLFARTDAIAVDGFEAAVERGNRYLEAGADVIFVEAPVDLDQAEALPRLIPGPLLYNWVWKGKSPLITRERLRELGYRFYLQADVLYPVAHALQAYFTELKRTGTYGAMAERMVSFDEFNQLVGLARIVDAERRYGSD
jgi:2-methylisocitrate lyase-like PEP mutase family enzyme